MAKSSTFSFSEADMPIRFGRYLLLKTKDRTPVGEEFLAAWGVDEGMDQLRVVRGIYPAVATDANFVKLFSDEARALSRLASANVVRVVEVGREGGIPFVACEHVEGLTLNRLIDISKQRGLSCPWEIATHIATEMLRGLDYVHRREDILGTPMGMRHGDVRPSNAIISFDGELKLTNFGSALYFIADERTNAKVQTYRGIYAPPELTISQSERATQAGDLWGVAATLSVLIGREECLIEDKTVSGKIDKFLAQSLAEDPTARFADAAAMRGALLAIMEQHAAGHPTDGLANWAKTLGAEDRTEEERIVRKMLGQDIHLDLTETAEEKKIGPGSILDGRYHLIRQLGEGGMGLVFSAEHLGIGRKVAVKILHERVLDDQTAIERFRREAQIMGSLGHPNIVHVSDFGTTSEGYHYLVMELLEGEILSDRIEKGAIEPEEIANIIAEVCDGLDVAHKAGIIHRDLKPENIFLKGTTPKLLDFGIAKRTDIDIDQSLTTTGFLCGTAEYMAPEQISGQTPDIRGDIYAAGVIIYEALTQKTPFRGRTIAETLHKAMIDKVVPPRKCSGEFAIPKQLEAICMKALSRNPNKRFLSAAEMAEALRSIPFSKRAAERPKALPSVAGFKGATLWAFLCLVVIFVAAAAWGLSRLIGSRANASRPIPVYISKDKSVEKTEPQEKKVEQNQVVILPAFGEKEQLGSTAESEVAKEKQTPDETVENEQAEIKSSEELVQTQEKKRELSVPVAHENKADDPIADLLEKGQLEQKAMRYDNAQALFEKALTLNPRSAEAWFLLGKTKFEKSLFGEAIKHIDQALTLRPGMHKWRNYLGKVHMAANQRDKAIMEWKKVLAADPSNEEAKLLLQDVGVSK